MGVEYDLISDSAREGYELGKGWWGGSEFEKALRSNDPVGEVTAHMIEDGFEPLYAAEVAREITAFASAHPDWRVINDCSSDISVMTDTQRDETLAEERADEIALGYDPDDLVDDLPIYKKVGSRYRKDR